jgi:hypothetical protein
MLLWCILLYVFIIFSGVKLLFYIFDLWVYSVHQIWNVFKLFLDFLTQLLCGFQLNMYYPTWNLSHLKLFHQLLIVCFCFFTLNSPCSILNNSYAHVFKFTNFCFPANKLLSTPSNIFFASVIVFFISKIFYDLFLCLFNLIKSI